MFLWEIAYDVSVYQKCIFELKHQFKQSYHYVSNIEINENNLHGFTIYTLSCKCIFQNVDWAKNFWLLFQFTEMVEIAFSKHVIFGLGTNATLRKHNFKRPAFNNAKLLQVSSCVDTFFNLILWLWYTTPKNSVW